MRKHGRDVSAVAKASMPNVDSQSKSEVWKYQLLCGKRGGILGVVANAKLVSASLTWCPDFRPQNLLQLALDE
jgi:hypothetical protein